MGVLIEVLTHNNPGLGTKVIKEIGREEINTVIRLTTVINPTSQIITEIINLKTKPLAMIKDKTTSKEVVGIKVITIEIKINRVLVVTIRTEANRITTTKTRLNLVNNLIIKEDSSKEMEISTKEETTSQIINTTIKETLVIKDKVNSKIMIKSSI